MPHGFGVSKGAASLLLIGAFLAMRALREEKALMSYGFLFPKSLRRCRRLSDAFLFSPAMRAFPFRSAGWNRRPSPAARFRVRARRNRAVGSRPAVHRIRKGRLLIGRTFWRSLDERICCSFSGGFSVAVPIVVFRGGSSFGFWFRFCSLSRFPLQFP